MTTKTFGIQVRDHNGKLAGFVCKDIVHARSTPFATDPDTAFAMAQRVNETEARRSARGDNPRTIISWKAAPLWSAPVVTETTPRRAMACKSSADARISAKPETTDLRDVRGKLKLLCRALDGTAHVGTGLTVYHAARAAIYGMRRVGTDRQLSAVKKALKPCAAMASVHLVDGIPCIRVHIPSKRIDLLI